MFEIVIVLGALWITPSGEVSERTVTDVKPTASYESYAACRTALKEVDKTYGQIGSLMRKFVQESEIGAGEGVVLKGYRSRVRCVPAAADVSAVLTADSIEE